MPCTGPRPSRGSSTTTVRFGQLGEVLAAGPDDHDGPAGRAGEDADRPGEQGGPVPFKRRLGRAHPRGPPAGQHHACGSRHFLIVRPAPPRRNRAGNRAGAGAANPYSCPVAEEDDEDHQPDAAGLARQTDDNSLGRLLTLSDGVFAIAMTLLALDLQVPRLKGHVASQQLIDALAQNTDSYWSFLLSFYVIALYWGAHRR